MKDWSDRIKSLESAGWTLSQIAQEIGLSVSGLSDIKQRRSAEPRGMAAVNLHELYGRVCGPKPRKSAA